MVHTCTHTHTHTHIYSAWPAVHAVTLRVPRRSLFFCCHTASFVAHFEAALFLFLALLPAPPSSVLVGHDVMDFDEGGLFDDDAGVGDVEPMSSVLDADGLPVTGAGAGAGGAGAAAPSGKGKAVEPSQRVTTRYMTKYERARLLGTRALQLRFVLAVQCNFSEDAGGGVGSPARGTASAARSSPLRGGPAAGPASVRAVTRAARKEAIALLPSFLHVSAGAHARAHVRTHCSPSARLPPTATRSYNAPPMVDPREETDPLKIAMMELKENKIPLIVRRYLPDGSYEDWASSELIQ